MLKCKLFLCLSICVALTFCLCDSLAVCPICLSDSFSIYLPLPLSYYIYLYFLTLCHYCLTFSTFLWPVCPCLQIKQILYLYKPFCFFIKAGGCDGQPEITLRSWGQVILDKPLLSLQASDPDPRRYTFFLAGTIFFFKLVGFRKKRILNSDLGAFFFH